ncbi:MAG: M20/M25/M40 family metallo-hydrolase [Actinomycetota bacterium]|nr:M20/M25/M40 family metallo-hydrolase [Actinomycetota bacterium]
MSVASAGIEPELLTAWVARLVAIPSVNPLQAGPRAGTPGEGALARATAAWCADLGADETHLDEGPTGRLNVYAIWRNEASDRWIGFDAHLDTVGVEHCDGDPFDAHVTNGRVHGRGSVDTKGGLATLLAVVDDLRRRGLRPAHNLLVAGTIAEEAGGMLGATMLREWLDARDLRIDELIVAEPTDCAPVHGHKGGVLLRVTVLGEAAHTAKPELGRNAVVGAARIALAYEAEHERLLTVPPATEVGGGTLTVTAIEGGSGSNIVPDRCTLEVGRRVAPGEDAEEVAAGLEAIARDACPLPVEIERVGVADAFYRPPDSPLASMLASWTGEAARPAPYGTNALRYLGTDRIDDMVVMGPGSIDIAHKAVEWVELTELVRMASALERWLTTER